MLTGLLLLWIVCLATCNNRVLVLLDKPSYVQSHATFLRNLKESGYQLEIKLSDSADLAIQKFNEYLYDHIIIFAPRTEEFGGMMNAKILAKFVDSGRNVLMAAGRENGEAVREFAAECGIRIDTKGSYIRDGFQAALNESVMLTDENLISCEVMTGKVKNLLYSGGNLFFNKSNYLITPVLSATSNSYVEDFNAQAVSAATGRNLHLIVSMQARNNARVTILGSADLFSDAFMFPRGKEVDNEEFSKKIVDWTFQRRGVLRLSEVHHHLVGVRTEPAFYTIRQDAHFSFKLDEFKDGKWVPFCRDDVQLEFIRIDPFIRQYMKCKDGVYSLDFKVPDVHGVYKFFVDYRKPGYSGVSFSKLIPVHPLRHDQYERFIPSALPYYVACLSMCIGVFLLSFVVLYHQDVSAKKKTQ